MSKAPRSWTDLPLVEVVWLDAAINTAQEGSLSAPESAATFGGLVQCRDIGYLVRMDRNVVVLAVGLVLDDAAGTYRHSNTIDRKRVQQIIPLTRPSLSPEAKLPITPQITATLISGAPF